VATAAPAGARVAPEPTVDVQPVAGLAPDGRSIGVQVLASCPERWTVVEAVVTVSQPGASGQASFPLTCIGSLRMFAVAVPSSGGAFQLGEAQVTASVIINRRRTMPADDSQVVPVQPTVLVELAETAQLESGGGAVTAPACQKPGSLSMLFVDRVGQGASAVVGQVHDRTESLITSLRVPAIDSIVPSPVSQDRFCTVGQS